MAPRFAHHDIVVELVELSNELIVDITQQLAYYRASVYKHETSKLIKDRIASLRLICNLIADDMVMEPFHDFDATEGNFNMAVLPGECSFSHRVSAFLTGLKKHLSATTERLKSAANAPQNLTQNIQKHRREILSFCKYGSRQWSFFQSF